MNYRLLAVFILIGVLACAGTQSTLWQSPNDSKHIPVVRVESTTLNREVVMTTRLPGIDIPTVIEDTNASGRMIITAWIRNSGRTQQMVEIKAKFFDSAGNTLDALGDWDQVFVHPGESNQVELSCGEDGAAFFKLLMR